MGDVKVSKRGRPRIYKSDMVRGSFRVPVTIVHALRKAGNGNITLGIIRLAQREEVSEQAPNPASSEE